MCISGSVGRGGANQKDDIRTIQILINLNLDRLTGIVRLAEDGGIGDPNKSKTVAAIEAFQRRIVNMATATGLIEPGSDTLKELRNGTPADLTAAKLHAIMPDASADRVTLYLPHIIAAMKLYEISTPLRQAHFLAQVGHESGDLKYNEEIASGSAYEGRSDLGNTQAGDGRRFKGRGLIQLTGRTNYRKYGEFKKRDFLTEPNNLVVGSDPALAADAAGWFWNTRHINVPADADNVDRVTELINGGDNGLPDRKVRLARARCIMQL
jgi:putative chitinase